MAGDLSIGLDIGGTKMAYVIADRDGNIHEALTLPSDSQQGLADMLQRIIGQLNEYLSGFSEIRGIGIGLPGPVDVEHGIALNAVNLGWQNIPIRAAIAEQLSRPMPIYVDNDVNVGAIGEQLFGVANGVGNYIYITVGTGIGGAIMLDNQLLRGASNSAMELGHVSLDPIKGRECPCGQRGCVEMSISGKGIVANARQQIHDFPQRGLDPETISTHEIIKWAEQDDPLALSIMEEAATALGIACAWCVNLVNPELIVLGGGLLHASYHLLEQQMLRAMQGRCLPLNFQAVTVKLAKQRNAALGAAALVWHQQYRGR